MTSSYSGFFVRDNLGSTPGQPAGGAWTVSPDIVQSGVTPLADPAQIVTAAGYATDYGGNTYLQTPNFVYARALNTEAGAATGRAWFYWVPDNLILWPQEWRFDQVTVAGNPTNYQDIAASEGNQVCMADLPFVWMPPPLPSPNTHYCCLLWIENQPSNPPVSPVANLPAFPSYDALGEFVMSTPYMGLRGLVDITARAPTWTQTVDVTGPPQPQPFSIGVQCRNMPTDGQVGFSVPAPEPGLPSIVVPPTPIPDPNLLLTAPVTDWPGGAQSSITVSYWQGATQPPANASIQVVMVLSDGITVGVESMSLGA